MSDTTPGTEPDTWDDLDAFPILRRADSIEAELALGANDDLRKRLESATREERNDLRRLLQRKASFNRTVDREGNALKVHLVALPFVLAYDEENAVPVEAALIRTGSKSALADRWRAAWETMIPGLSIIPASFSVLFDELIGASPADVVMCLQDGAFCIREGRAIQDPRVGEGDHRDRWHAACGPVAATYLSLAFAVCPDDGTDEPAAIVPGDTSRASELLQAIFASRNEAPHIEVLAPAPFFDAIRKAAVAHVRHFVDWGNANDPTWHLDLIAPEKGTRLRVVGAFDTEAGDDARLKPHARVSWGWDRVWWTDEQVDRFQRDVDDPQRRAALRGTTHGLPGQVVPRRPAGLLH